MPFIFNPITQKLDYSAPTLTKATGADIDAGTNNTKYATPKALTDSKLSFTDGTEILTNKTLTSPVINTGTIGTSLLPTTTDGAPIGSTTKMFSDLFLASGGVINWNDGDITLTHSANTLTLGGGALALGSNNLTMTGSLAATGSRVTKGWFTNVEITNLPTINGGTLATALSLSGTNTGDQTSIVGITGTKANFDTACSDGNFLYSGDAPTAHAASHAVGTADTVFPADPGADKYLKWDDDPGVLVWADSGAGGGATTALDNLAAVAINTTLVSDTYNTDALGTTAIAWSDLFLGTGAVIEWSSAASTADITLTHSANLLSLAGGNLALGGGNISGAGTINGTIITASTQLISDVANDTPATCALIDFRRSRDGDPTDSVSDDDYLGELRFRGYHTAAFYEGAIIRAVVNGTPGANDMPCELIFATSADGSATPTTRLTIDATGLSTFAGAVTLGTSNSLTCGSIEVGAANDTTISRTGAGIIAVEGQNVLTSATGAAIAQTFYIGTTQVAINRGSAALTLAGITLTTPDIGVATATSVNKVAITAPASAATLTIADGQTLTVNGSATITNGTHSGTNTGDGTYGIANTNYVKIDSADVADDEYARFTANGLEGRTAAEVLSAIAALPLAGGTLTGDVQLGETDIKLDAALSADEKWSGIVIAGTAGSNVAVGDVCFLASDGKWDIVDGILDGTDVGFKAQIGICLLAGADTEATEMLVYGKVRSAAFPAFTVGAPVYLHDTAGDLVVAQPSTANFAIRIVGYAITAEDLLFNPSNDYIVHV